MVDAGILQTAEAEQYDGHRRSLQLGLGELCEEEYGKIGRG